MLPPLTVAVAQPSVADLDVDTNVDRHARLVRAAEADLVVFPELSLTGYVLTAPAVRPDDPRLGPLVSACRAVGGVALVGAPARADDGSESIAVIAVTGEGATVAYRKMCLHGDGELARFAPGPAPAVIEVGGWRLGLAVCYDVGVPEHAAAAAAMGIDAYVAGTLYRDSAEAVSRRDSDMRARASRHGVWGVMAAGAGPTGSFAAASGGSGIWAPGGSVVVQAGSTPGEMVRATLVSPRQPSPDPSRV